MDRSNARMNGSRFAFSDRPQLVGCRFGDIPGFVKLVSLCQAPESLGGHKATFRLTPDQSFFDSDQLHKIGGSALPAVPVRIDNVKVESSLSISFNRGCYADGGALAVRRRACRFAR